MKILLYRTVIGLAGLTLFFMFGYLSGKEFAKLGALMGSVLLGVGGLFALRLARPRWAAVLARVVYLLFFLDAAIKGFLRSYFGMRPNYDTVLQAAFNTNPGESQEFLIHNWRALGLATGFFIVLSGAALLLARRLDAWPDALSPGRAGLGARLFSGVMLLLCISLHINTTMRRENPVLYWPVRYVEYQREQAEMKAMRALVDASMAPRSDWKVSYVGGERHTMIFVIGESTNRANMSLYGYGRATTPTLDRLRGQMLVFKDVISSDSNTAGSLMKMLTPADLAHPKDWHHKPNILMLAEAAGYKTFWISNQARNDGWLGMISDASDERRFINNGAGRGENNLDENLLPPYEQALADQAPKKLIVVHLLGAHPTYSMRYPARFAGFSDNGDAVSRKMEHDGRSLWTRQLRGEYDNAILYGDYVLGSLLQRAMRTLGREPATLLYVSDHGQEVGHFRDHAGHSSVDKSGYEIPMLLWKSQPDWPHGPARTALENRPYQTDKLDSTLLGLLHIESAYYHASDDIESAAFVPVDRFMEGNAYDRPGSRSMLAGATRGKDHADAVR